MEELKERLEPGAGQQLPPQHPAQPRSPPAPSPLPAALSPRPEVSWARLQGGGWGWGGAKMLGWRHPAAAGVGVVLLPTPFCCALQSPALMEGPRGTAGDSEAVTGGLPRPLWHKQLRVEEDFGDLLEQ